MHSGLPLPLSLFVDVNVEDTNVTTWSHVWQDPMQVPACVAGMVWWLVMGLGFSGPIGPWRFFSQKKGILIVIM